MYLKVNLNIFDLINFFKNVDVLLIKARVAVNII